MTSVCTSLRTDPEVSEFDENLLNSSQHLNFELPPDPTLIENIENLFNNFPETSLSISSSHDNSDEVRFVKAKNIEMKEALRINVWKLKAASEKIVNSPNSKRFEEIIEEAKQKKKSAMELVAFSNLQTGDTENNAEILQEIAINIKNLNDNLEVAKMNLRNDLQSIESLNKEHESLEHQLNQITDRINNSLSIESNENTAGASCKCEIF